MRIKTSVRCGQPEAQSASMCSSLSIDCNSYALFHTPHFCQQSLIVDLRLERVPSDGLPEMHFDFYAVMAQVSGVSQCADCSLNSLFVEKKTNGENI